MPDLPPPPIRTLFRSRLIHVLDYRCAGHNSNGEVPHEHEIVLPRRGAYQRRNAQGTILADANQVLFHNPGEPYDISHPVRGGDSSTVFLLDPVLLLDMIGLHDRDMENHPARLFRRSSLTLQTRLQAIQFQLLNRGEEPRMLLAREEQILTAVKEIVHALYREEPDKKTGSRRRSTRLAHQDQMQAVKLFLHANLRSPVQLADIASAVHLSPFHLCRVFRQQTGMTLHRYLRRLRLFHAAEQMLESPPARLDLLALEYGFSNHGHFATTFRQVFGIQPSDFRRMSKIL